MPVSSAAAMLPQPASAGRVRGDMQQLSQELNRLEGKGYKAYRCSAIQGRMAGAVG
jgi:hypothetical protein